MVVSGILVDGRFDVPTKEAKVCLDLRSTEVCQIFIHMDSQDCCMCRLFNWLVATLQTVVRM